MTGPEQHDLRGVEGVTIGPLNIQPVSGPPTPGGPKTATGPEQHAATVEEWVRSRMSPTDGPESRQAKSIAGRAALAELVALARDGVELRKTLSVGDIENLIVSEGTRKRAEAAEARADELQREATEANALAYQRHVRIDELQRERDEWRRQERLAVHDAERLERERDEAVATAEAIDRDMRIEREQARREGDQLRAERDAADADCERVMGKCDQLRAALREISVLTPFNTPESASSVMQGPAIARAALAGAPSGPSEVERLRAALERIANTDLSREPMLMQEAKGIARAALAGVQDDNKDSA